MIRKTGLADQGLFSRLQSYFASSFGGRYVEHLLKETIEERPALAQRLFGIGRVRHVEVEHRFRANGATRIADLAFFGLKNQGPLCLVEIKYDDHKNPGNAAQLKDYLRYSQITKCNFIYLSQHLPPESARSLLRQNKRALLLFSDIANGLDESERSLEGLLRRFFVDKGLVMHKFGSREYAHLRSFMFRLFNPYGGQGRSHTREGMSGGVADAFGELLRNMNIIAREVTSDVVDRQPTIDFWADQYVRANRIAREALKSRSDDIPTSNSRAGGCLWVYARSSLGAERRSWMNVEFGIGLEVLPNDRNIYASTYALVGSNLFSDDATYSDKSAGQRVIHDKSRAVSALKQRILESIGKALNLRPPRKYSRRLAEFRQAISR